MSTAVAIGLGAAVRLVPPLTSHFPIGDGGLFYTMVQNLQANHYRLPSETTYNAEHIPFAYPPLGIYVAASLQSATGWDSITIFRLLPPVVSTLSVVFFFLLARQMLFSPIAVTGSTLSFALLPYAFQGEIMGGGVARAFGELFCLLTALFAARFSARRGTADLGMTALFGALTVLSHPQWAEFAALSVPLIFLLQARPHARLLWDSVLLVGAVVVLSAPWWLTVVFLHGPAVFTTVVTSRYHLPWYSGLADLFFVNLTAEPWFPVFTAAALVGALWDLVSRRWLLSTWVVAAFLVDPASALITAVLPLSLLAGEGVAVILALLDPRGIDGPGKEPAGRVPGWLAPVLLGLLALRGLSGTAYWELGNLGSLTSGDRNAFQWAGRHTPSSARFLILTGRKQDPRDAAEWFPALTDRVSVTTSQGSEWLGGDAFNTRYTEDAAIQACTSQDVLCLENRLKSGFPRFEYLYVSAQSPAFLRSIDRSTRFRAVYRGTGVFIYRQVSRS